VGFKQALKTLLPRWVVVEIQKRRYVKSLGKVSVESDPDFRGVEKIVAAGDTVLDIGANMGFYTVFLSRLVGPKGLVVSVEPVDTTYRLLRHISRQLSLDNVRCMNLAVSDHPGKLTMEVPVNADGQEDYFLAKIVSGEGDSRSRKVVVDVNTIDGLVAEGNLRVSFLKIDVEGHELTSLKGAKALFEKQQPALIIEVWGDPDNKDQPGIHTFAYLKSLGYAPYLWKEGKFQPRQPGETSVNYFFFHPRHVEKFVKGAAA